MRMFRHYYEEIINYLLKGTFWKGATDAERNVIRKRSAKYKVINGVLYHKGKGRGIEDLRLVASTKADQQNAIRMCHVSEADEQHFGNNKTASLLASRFYWRMMYTDVIQYIENCPSCQAAAKGTEVPVPPPPPPPPPSPVEEKLWVWRMLEVQVLENFQVNGKKVYHLLRIVDVHSNWTALSFLEDSGERTAVRSLFRECSLLGFPQAFRFVNVREDASWMNMFVSALHQELDGFSSICGQEVDTSIHVVIEENVPDWNPEQCLDSCQQMILAEPAALYVFFGSRSLVDQSIHDWYLDQVNQFVKKEPFWWPHRLPSFMFHLRNSLPPGMTNTPASVLASGVKGESHLFLPIAPEKEQVEEPEPVPPPPVVAQPPPKELLALSCFRTGKEPPKPVKQTTDASAQTKNNHKEATKETLVSDSQPAKRKAESSKLNSSSSKHSSSSSSSKHSSSSSSKHSSGSSSSSNKRLHPSSKSSSSSSSAPVRTREEQEKIDEGIKEALEVVISQGMKDLERVKKKKKKKHSKKNNDHTNATDMFEMLPPIVLPPRRSPALDMAMSSGMSSLEALKAVTGTSIPQSVPPSPLLSSAMLSPTTPEENSPAPPQEEASPGRYSFRQNLKPKGTSNFIRRLIAKTSSKRYTGVPETSDIQPQWQPSPPKKSRRHRKLHSSQTPSSTSSSTPSTAKAPSDARPVQISTPLSNTKHLSPVVQAPEKDPAHNSFSPSSLTLELSSTSTESNSSPSQLKRADSTTLDEDFEPSCNLRLTRAEEELIDQTIKGVDENGFMDADKIVGDAVLAVEEISKDELSGMEVSDSDVAISSTSNTVTKTDSVDSVNANIVNSLFSVPVTDGATAVPDGEVLESYHLTESEVQKDTSFEEIHVSENTEQVGLVNIEQNDNAPDGPICDDDAMDVSEVENTEVCTTEVASDVIFDVLDTCETYEVGDKKHDEEISENTEENELERLKDKISQDLASGLTTDKTKTAQAQQCVDADNADTDEYSIMASACHALLHMASATGFVGNDINKTPEEDKSATVNEKPAEITDESQLTTSIEIKPSSVVESGTSVQDTVPTVEDVTAKEDKIVIAAEEECSAKDSATEECSTIEAAATEECATIEAAATEDCATVECATEVGSTEEDSRKESKTEESFVKESDKNAVSDASAENTEEDESELCLPSDFFLDEAELAEIPAAQSPSTEEKVERSHEKSVVVTDQDIVTILNSIMSNRAFLDDPVARLQREKEDRRFKELHGLKKDLKIKIKAMAERVVQRAVLGAVPVRTIRNNERRAYYVGNIKIDEFNTPVVGPQAKLSPFSCVKPPSLLVKRARVHLPKMPSASMGPMMKSLPTMAKILPPTKVLPPKEVSKPDSGGSGRSTPQDLQSNTKKGKPFGCPICPRTYVISQEMLDLHIAFHIDNARNLHCPVCGKAGNIWTNILKHYLCHQEAKDNASLYEMILASCDKDRRHCGQCNTLFALRNALIHHLQSSHIGEKVNGTLKVRVIEGLVPKKPVPEATPVLIPKSSTEAKEVNYLCPDCPYSTKTHYNLILHSHECQGNVEKIGDSFTKILDDLTPQFKCTLCGYCGVSSKQLEQHMRLHHGSSNATPNRSPPKMLECKYPCEFCTLKFRTTDQLRCHLMKHKEASMFHCKACNYKCRYKKIMHRHVHKVHPNLPLRGLIQAPKKLRLHSAGLVGQQKVQAESDEDMKDSEQENDNDEGIPTATVVVHTDENGELTVCDENEVSTIPLEPEQTTYLLDSSTLDSSTVTLDGSAVTLDGSAVTIDGSAVALDGSVTLDGNVLQLLQSDGGDCNGQPKVLFLSVGPSEMESFSSSTFTIAGQNSSS